MSSILVRPRSSGRSFELRVKHRLLGKPAYRTFDTRDKAEDAGRKIFLILDNLDVHHGKAVKARLAEHRSDIGVFYLPSYSPELNPEERLNADPKHAIGTQVPARTKARLRAAAEQHVKIFQADPQRVRAYFQAPLVRYAA